MSKKLKALAFVLSVLSLSTGSAIAAQETGGFSLGSTRVVYEGKNKEATYTVINSAKNTPFLAQSWITAYDENDKSKPPFVITPPLYRQDNGKNTLRIVRAGGDLPNDRESAFWLNVKAIPAGVKPSDKSNSVSFAYVLKVKLFYRPASLTGNASSAYKELTFTKDGNKLVVKNPTPYHVTLNKLSVDGKAVKEITQMVPPLGQQSYQLPASVSGNKVTYQAVNDLGGVMPEQIKNL
ncbi:fimbrial biogenesis chaperone [Pantoea agglomerans]